MEQITVGLDFGTHQTKICIERKEGAELGYSFFKFPDTSGTLSFTLPSIIQVKSDGTMDYGFVNKSLESNIIRYFKQAAFASSQTGLSKTDATLYSIWYIAFILFALEEKYGQNFTIQMGVPTDGSHLETQRQHAVSILASAYKLVEEVFENDKEAFLNTSIDKLKEITQIVKYSKAIKEEYGILVFPEAYACLMPLVASAKIDGGMSLMVDIGGGTTDISFFSIEKNKHNPKENKLRVYDFTSINKGLNFLTASNSEDQNRTDSNVRKATELHRDAIIKYKGEINNICSSLRGRLLYEFKRQCNLPEDNLRKALSNRPIVYTGGGSSFEVLRHSYHGFVDEIHISHKNWKTAVIAELNTIISMGLCPILSTAYGLSISRPNDKIICEPLRDLFSGLRHIKQEKKGRRPNTSFGLAIGGSQRFDYMDDYDAWK